MNTPQHVTRILGHVNLRQGAAGNLEDVTWDAVAYELDGYTGTIPAGVNHDIPTTDENGKAHAGLTAGKAAMWALGFHPSASGAAQWKTTMSDIVDVQITVGSDGTDIIVWGKYGPPEPPVFRTAGVVVYGLIQVGLQDKYATTFTFGTTSFTLDPVAAETSGLVVFKSVGTFPPRPLTTFK